MSIGEAFLQMNGKDYEQVSSISLPYYQQLVLDWGQLLPMNQPLLLSITSFMGTIQTNATGTHISCVFQYVNDAVIAIVNWAADLYQDFSSRQVTTPRSSCPSAMRSSTLQPRHGERTSVLTSSLVGGPCFSSHDPLSA